MKVLIYQQRLLASIPEADYEEIKSHNPNIVCLPEYFFHPDFISYDDSIAYMKKCSKDFNTILIGGTTVLHKNGNSFNACYIFDKGKEVGYYKKIHLFQPEVGRITPGTEYKVFTINNVKIGLLICADALHNESWVNMSKLNPDIIFIPTFSPFKEESHKEKFKRDNEIYVNGAKTCNSIIVKVCCIGKFKNTSLQGRSLVADKNGIIWRVDPQNEKNKIIKSIILEINEQ